MSNGPLSAMRMRYSRLRRQQLDEVRALEEEQQEADHEHEHDQQRAGRRPGREARGPVTSSPTDPAPPSTEATDQ